MIAALMGLWMAAASPSASCESSTVCRVVPDFDLKAYWFAKPARVHVPKAVDFIRTQNGHPTLVLFPGETVTLRLGAPGEPPMIVLSAGRVDAAPQAWSEAKIGEEARRLTELDAHGKTITDQSMTVPERKAGDLAEAAAPLKDTIRVTFKQFENSTAMYLLIQDGYGRTLNYEAEGPINGRWVKLGACKTTSDRLRPNAYLFALGEIGISNLRLTDDDPEDRDCPTFRSKYSLVSSHMPLSYQK